MSDCSWSNGLQHARLPCPTLSPRVCSNSCPLSRDVTNHLHLCHPLLILPSVFPSIRVFSNELAFCIRWPKYWSFSFSISPSSAYSGLNSLRLHWFDLLLVQWDSQESSLASQFESNSSLALSLLCRPTFTSVHDCWKNRNFDYMDLCQQSDISAF